MSWFGLNDEERKEWRNAPTTKAFFATIREQIADTKNEVVSALADDTEVGSNTARRMAGRVDGMEVVLKIMETDT